MTERPPPEGLAEFQARFGAVIRTPLARSSGKLTATPSSYDPAARAEALDGPAASGDERLAVYNRQYWFRLFGVLQTAFPLVTRLLGHWVFNDFAARFLLAHHPRSWDLDRAPDGFETFLAEVLERVEAPVESEALIEAARIDAAWRRVFSAPPVEPYRPSARDAARLLAGRLTPSPAVAVVQERWPLLELRRKVRDYPGEAPVQLPARLGHAQSWALVRRPEGIGHLALEAREAELFRLLERHTVHDGLARLEAACPEEERAELPARCRTWLARSVELEFWIGLDLPPEPA